MPIELDVGTFSVDKDEYLGGSIVPFYKPTKQDEKPAPLGEFVGALVDDTPAVRWGVGLSGWYDDLLRSANPNDNGVTVDPTFNAFEEWKKGGYTLAEADEIMDITNRRDFDMWRETRNDNMQRQNIIDQYGLVGDAANLAANIVGDPTVWAGFGAVKMVNAGLSTAKALSISAGASAATYEAIDYTLSPQGKTPTESLVNIGAAAVMGGILGKGADFIGDMIGRGRIKKDFYQLSTDALRDAADHPIRVDQSVVDSSVGAMQVPSQAVRDARLGGNAVAQWIGRLTSFSPKVRGQMVEDPEIAEMYQMLMGQAGLSRSNVSGAETPASVADILFQKEAEAVRHYHDIKTAIIEGKRTGDVFTEANERNAILAVINKGDGVFSKTEQRVADVLKKYFAKQNDDLTKAFANYDEATGDLQKTAGGFYRTRKDFGIPHYYNPEKITANFDRFVDLLYNKTLRTRDNAANLIVKREAEIASIERAIVKVGSKKPDGTNIMKANTRLIELQEELDNLKLDLDDLKLVKSMTDSKALEEARILASDIANGASGRRGMRDIKGDRIIPRRFMPRSFKTKDVLDFIETNPALLLSNYAREVMPHYASKKVFNLSNPAKYLDYAVDRKKAILATMEQGSPEALRLKKEIDNMAADFKGAWDSMTGAYTRADAARMGMAADALQASSDMTNVLLLGGQTIASLTEPFAGVIARGLTGSPQYIKAMTHYLTNTDFRKFSSEQAKMVGNGMEIAKNAMTKRIIDGELQMGSMNGKISKVTGYLANRMQLFNLSVFFDQFNRTLHTVVQHQSVIDGLKRLGEGNATKTEIGDLAYLGFGKGNKDIQNRVLAQWDKYSVEEQGVKFANVDSWDDREAADLFSLALRRDLQRTSMNPDVGDTPFFFKTLIGKNMFKFWSWPVTAFQKYTMMTAQRGTAAAWAGLGLFVGIGGAIDVLINVSQGAAGGPDALEERLEQYKDKDGNWDVASFTYAAVNRAGVLSVLPQMGGSYLMNKIFDIQSGGAKIYNYDVDLPFAFGPLQAVAKDIGKVSSEAIKATRSVGDDDEDYEIKPSAVKSIIDLMPVPLIKPYMKEYIDAEFE